MTENRFKTEWISESESQMNSEAEKLEQTERSGQETQDQIPVHIVADKGDSAEGAAPVETEEATDPREIQLEQLQKDVDCKNKEIADMKTRYHRSLADYDNLRRRSAKEVLDAMSRGSEKFVAKLLPVLDTFESAMRQIAKANADKKVLDGLEMLSIQFSDVLEKEGLKEIAAQGQKFDPNLHEAFFKSSREDVEDDIVLNVLEKGYTFKDRVLRPAKVEINQK